MNILGFIGHKSLSQLLNSDCAAKAAMARIEQRRDMAMSP
jgi:hypothetical protein